MILKETTLKEGMTHKAYRIIKEMIIKNKLSPGERITETQLREQLGMSRTPIREAILQLSYDGFIIVYPRKCIEVVQVSPKMIRSVFDMRMIIEPNILKKNAKNLSYDILKNMRDEFVNCNLCSEQSEENFINKLIDMDYKFHLYLIETSNNEYASILMDKLLDYATMIRFSTRVQNYRYLASCNEHIVIIDSLLNGDIEEASKKLFTHIEICYKETMQIFWDS